LLFRLGLKGMIVAVPAGNGVARVLPEIRKGEAALRSGSGARFASTGKIRVKAETGGDSNAALVRLRIRLHAEVDVTCIAASSYRSGKEF
jgi:hypothetical protein